jgi:hypothetical protein
MKILEFLCQRPDGLGHLTDDERESAISFALLYMYFEARLVNTKANADTLKRLAAHLAGVGSVDVQGILQCYEYFRNRYWGGAGSTQYVYGLRMSNALADEVLPRLANSPDAHGKLVACLLIILRYRNNLFHGTKWKYGLEGQKENFDQATQLLLAVIALDDAARGNAN